jgi:TRAP transporter TAXI family solute receptor
VGGAVYRFVQSSPGHVRSHDGWPDVFSTEGCDVSNGIARAIAAAALAAMSACRSPAEVPPPQRVKLLSRVVVSDLSQALVDRYNRSIPGIVSSLVTIPGSEFVVNALQDGDAELGFAQADVVYTAYRSGTSEHRTPYQSLRAIAVAQRATVFAVVRESSPIRRFTDLKGQRVGLDTTGSYGEVYARMVLKAYGLDQQDLVLSHQLPDGLAAGLRDATLDAAMFVGSSDVAITRINKGVAIRFLDLDRATINELRGHYPFMTPATMRDPGGSDDAAPLHTVGVDNVLVCRGDLSEDLVYRLTMELFAESDRLLTENPAAPPWIDFERAPATPIPLHPGAARYYRERQILQ